jgi:transposase
LQGSPERRRREGREPRHGAHKRGLNTKIHLAVDGNGMPIRFIVTKGTTHDCKLGIELIEGMEAEYLLADRGYDSDEIVNFAEERGMITVIPPKKNRKEQRFYDKAIYKARHLVENAFLKLKRWRGIAMRYAKTTVAFLGSIQCCSILLWLRVLV